MNTDQLAVEWAKAVREHARIVGMHLNPPPMFRDMLDLVRTTAMSRNGNLGDVGREIGVRLAEIFGGDPAALEATQRFLLTHLLVSAIDPVAGVSKEGCVDLVSALAASYSAAARDGLLEAQHVMHQPTVEVMWDAQQALFESEARFRAVFDGSVVGMCVCDLDHRILNANGALLGILGRELHELIGISTQAVLVQADTTSDVSWDCLEDVAAGRIGTYQVEAQLRRKDGTGFWAHLSTSLIRDQDGTPSYMISLVQDITDRKTSEMQLRRNEERVRALIQNSSDIISVISASGNMLFISPSVSRVLGFRREELLGEPFVDLITEESRPSFQLTLEDLKDRPNQTIRAEMRGRHRDGTWRWLEVVCTNLVDVEDIGGFVLNARDVTDRKAFEQQLEWQAFHDPLTALPNRMHFRDCLDQELARAARHRRSVGVLFIDLDRFKVINDSLGHGGGDQTLVSVGQRILDTLRSGELVARFGGDEFAVLIDDATPASAKSTAARILSALARPVPVLHRLSSVEASIGIALSDTALDQADSLMRAADIALYRAKALGGATSILYETQMHSEALRRIELETDLQMALERNEIEPYFQPEYNIQTGELRGLEVLMRWHRRKHGLTLPDVFLPFAEESGIIAQLGEYTFRTACTQLRSWIDAGIVPDDLYLSFNLSQRETRLPDLVETIERILSEIGIDPRRIQFEISEQALTSGDEVRLSTAAKLKRLGAKLTVDQFGSGPSSLTLFRDLPITGLKVDRSFHIRALETDPEGGISSSIVAIGGRLHIQMTILGLETEEQLEDARATGFHCGQGFYLSPPLAAQGIVDLLS